MDFTYVEFPCTVDLNVFKAYFNLCDVKLPKIHGKSLQTSEAGEVNTNQAKMLRHLVLDSIIENWNEVPLFKEIPRQADRNYVLSNLDVNLPLKRLSAHIQDNFFWRKCYQHRWKAYQTNQLAHSKPWINIYMERHLQEFIENTETCDYDQESVQATLDICAPYINQLEINYLQPSADGRGDHIPLDFILSNLPELHTLRLTYCTKTVSTNYYLGCNTVSQHDMLRLAKGLSSSHDLVNFCMHSTKLEAYQLSFFSRSLDKGCHNLSSLSLVHCALCDEGIRQFLEACNKESFTTLKSLDLTNNKISAEGAYILSRVLRGFSLENLVLRLNPIQSDGAAAIFSTLNYLPIKYFDIGGCSISGSITKLFMQLVVQNKTLLSLDASNNELGEEFGIHLYKVIGFNKSLQSLDLRNTGISAEVRHQLKEVLMENVLKEKSYKTKQ